MSNAFHNIVLRSIVCRAQLIRPLAASPYRRIAVSPYRRIAVSPYRRIAVSPHRRIAASRPPYPNLNSLTQCTVKANAGLCEF
jgi:hypothetical protein